MGYVFVSYAREDSRKVNRVIEELKVYGFEFWQDTSNIKTGKKWPTEITKAIVGCSRFLLFMSTVSMDSDNVTREVQIAYENGKKIIILRLDDSKLNHEVSYQLIGIQRTDYLSANWEEKIVSALGGRKLAQKLSPTPEQEPAPSRSLPRKAPNFNAVASEIENIFSTNGEYHRDQCTYALSKLEDLYIIVGNHWVNPSLVYKELIPRVYLLEKIEFIRNLIDEFRDSCPPGKPVKRQEIYNELVVLTKELSHKTRR